MSEMYQRRLGLEAKIAEKASKDEGFRKALKDNPKETIKKDFGMTLPVNLDVKIVEETPNVVYLRIPARPDELSDDLLSKVSGGDSSGCGCFCY